MFDLNIMTSTLKQQIDMLMAAYRAHKLQIKYVELGNELYPGRLTCGSRKIAVRVTEGCRVPEPCPRGGTEILRDAATLRQEHGNLP